VVVSAAAAAAAVMTSRLIALLSVTSETVPEMIRETLVFA